MDILDKRRAEVVVEVEILEVNRARLKEYGIEITSRRSRRRGHRGRRLPGPARHDHCGDNPYAKNNLVVTGLPGVIYRLLQTDTSTRLLANPQLRTTEGQTAQARFGDQVPVPVTTFSPIATGGVAQQPITSFEYKNVGRQHRHHAARPPRRRGLAEPQDRHLVGRARRASRACPPSTAARSRA